MMSSGVSQRLPDFLQDDLALPLQLALVEGRAGQNVRQDIHSQRHVGLQDAGMEGRLLAARIGVQEAAHGLNFLGYVPGAPPLRALEGHVFEHVGDAHEGLGLMPGAAVHPDAKSGAFQLRHGVGYDRQAIG